MKGGDTYDWVSSSLSSYTSARSKGSSSCPFFLTIKKATNKMRHRNSKHNPIKVKPKPNPNPRPNARPSSEDELEEEEDPSARYLFKVLLVVVGVASVVSDCGCCKRCGKCCGCHTY